METSTSRDDPHQVSLTIQRSHRYQVSFIVPGTLHVPGLFTAPAQPLPACVSRVVPTRGWVLDHVLGHSYQKLISPKPRLFSPKGRMSKIWRCLQDAGRSNAGSAASAFVSTAGCYIYIYIIYMYIITRRMYKYMTHEWCCLQDAGRSNADSAASGERGPHHRDLLLPGHACANQPGVNHSPQNPTSLSKKHPTP